MTTNSFFDNFEQIERFEPDLLLVNCLAYDNFLDWTKFKTFPDDILKVALQILGRKFYKNTKISSIYSQIILVFIHKTAVVEHHPTTGEIREFIQPRSTPMGITVYFYMSSSLIYILEIHRRKFQS